MTIYYYAETLDHNRKDYCGTVADVKEEVLSSLYALTEDSSYTPVWTVHGADDLPEIDENSDEYDEAEKAAIDAYLEGGGTYPFYVVRTPGEPADESFYCCAEGGDEPDWEALLNEWQCFLDGSVHVYQTTFFYDTAEFILDALRDGNNYKAATVAQFIFDVPFSFADNFCEFIKAIKGGGLRKHLEESGDDFIDDVYYIANFGGEDAKFIDDGFSIDEVENQVKEALKFIDKRYEIELTSKLF